MNILHKRPLSIILCCLLGGFVLFSFLDSSVYKQILLLFTLLAFGLCTVLVIFKKRALPLICVSAILISYIFSYVYFDIWFSVSDRFDDEVTVYGTVTDEKQYETYSVYTLKTENINDEPFTKYRISFTLNKSEKNLPSVGAEIKVKGTLSSTEGEHKSIFRSFSSYGISGYLEEITHYEKIGEGELPLSSKIAHIRNTVTRYAITISNEDCGTLLCALLFGERDELSPRVRLNFSRIGISHILALSGMHLAILSVGINSLLSLLRVKKKPRTVALIFFALLYSAFTGFSVTVLRASIMLIISSVMFLMSESHDSVSSLCIAIFIICILSPYAIFGISLWLSALATFGVIVSAEYISTLEKPSGALKKLYRRLLSLILPTVFAISATLLITTEVFGGLSLVSPFTTLIFSFLVEIIMYIGTFMLILGPVIPLSYLLIPLSEITLNLADVISSSKASYISSRFLPLELIILLLTVLFYLFALLNIKRKGLAVGTVISVFILTFTLGFSTFIYQNERNICSYGSDKNLDIFVLSSDGEAVMLSSGSHSVKSAKGGLNILSNENITYLDALIYTHYSYGLEKEINELISDIFIEQIYLPKPITSEEKELYSVLITATERYGIEIITYSVGENVTVGNNSFTSLYSSPYGESSITAYMIESKAEKTLYLSSGALSGSMPEETLRVMNMSDNIILGSYGTKYKDELFIDSLDSAPDRLIINSDGLYLTQQLLEKLENNGCKVYSHRNYFSFTD